MTIKERWYRLSVRERKGLALAAALVLVAGAWRGVWLPLQWRNAQALEQQAEHMALARRLATITPAQVRSDVLTAERLHQTLVAGGMQIKRLDVSGSRAQLSLTGAASKVWPWIEVLDRYQVVLEQLSMAVEGEQLQLTLTLSGLAQPD